jgi:hypothetical protein
MENRTVRKETVGAGSSRAASLDRFVIIIIIMPESDNAPPRQRLPGGAHVIGRKRVLVE